MSANEPGDTPNDNDNDNDPLTPVASGQPRTENPGREPLRPPLPKRFYTAVTTAPRAAGFEVFLDGRGIRTPGKKLLSLPSAALADAIAEEWRAQGERIDPATMPLTRLANTTVDAVAGNGDAVRADIVAFAGSDALCYRAVEPQALIDVQAAAFDPILGWAADALGARFITQAGIIHIAQPEDALAAIDAAIAPLTPWQLTAVHVLTTLTGSAILAVGLARGDLTADQAWAAAHVDEDWQITRWGEDEEAARRRLFRHGEFLATVRLLDTLR